MARQKSTDLTARELQVAKGIALGRTTGEIASELGIGEKTVATFRAHVRGKLGARNDVEIARHALRVGWVTLEQEAA